MADFEVTSPDGKTFVVSAPEGATQEQVLAYAQSQFSQPAAPAKAPAAPASASDRLRSAAMGGFMRNSLPGMGLDLIRESSAITGEKYNKAAYNAGGAVTDVATNLGASPEVAAGAGLAANVGIQAVPTLLSYGAGAGLTKAAATPVAKSLMQSAIKPSPKHVLSGKADKAVDTLLEQGINVSRGGVTKLQQQIGGLEDEISRVLSKSPASVDKYAVAATLKDAWAKVQKELSPDASTEKIAESFKAFINHPLLQSNQIPVKLANEMKQEAYRKLGESAYGLGAQNTATSLAEKTLARGLRENIGRAEPEISPMLADQSELVNALKVIGNRAATESNKNPFGLGLLASNPLAGAAFAVDRSALLKSLLARGIFNVSPPIGGLLAGGLTTQVMKNQ
jgi:hypothetical protein